MFARICYRHDLHFLKITSFVLKLSYTLALRFYLVLPQCVHLCSHVYHDINASERREDDESLLYHKLVWCFVLLHSSSFLRFRAGYAPQPWWRWQVRGSLSGRLFSLSCLTKKNPRPGPGLNQHFLVVHQDCDRYQGRLVEYGHCDLDHRGEEMKPFGFLRIVELAWAVPADISISV